MRSTPSFVRWIGGPLIAAAFATACDSPQRTVAPLAPSAGAAYDKHDDDDHGAGGSFTGFSPLASSAVCTVPGGDPVNPLLLPTGFKQSIVASEPSFADAIDMNTQNETGPQAGRYLYRPTEGGVGEVSVTDLQTGVTKRIAFRADWRAWIRSSGRRGARCWSAKKPAARFARIPISRRRSVA